MDFPEDVSDLFYNSLFKFFLKIAMINILEAFDIRVTRQISSFLGKGTVGENSGVFTRNAGKGNTNSFYLRHFKTD